MELFKFGEDIWITDKPVLPHTDSTADGMLTYGLILINTGYVLVYDGNVIQIPVGSVYEIDGRLMHQTVGCGILAILIWDMPDYSLSKFKADLLIDPRNLISTSPSQSAPNP